MISKWWSILVPYAKKNWNGDIGHMMLAIIFSGVVAATPWFGYFTGLLIGASLAGFLKEVGDSIKAKRQTGKFFPRKWHEWDRITDWLTWQFAWPVVFLHNGEWRAAIALAVVLLVVTVPLIIKKYSL